MLRYAVIGTNFITDRFIAAANECEDIELIGVYSRDITRAKEFADKYGAKLTFDQIEDLADSDQIDLVYVASPNSLHFSQSITLLNKKKHVICEKTIASNSLELGHMLQTAASNNVILLEAMRTVFAPGYLAIAEHLNKLGKIRRATFFYCKYSSRYDNYRNGMIENAFDPKLSNGALTDIGVYCVHALVKLFGMPKEIHTSGVILENGVDGAGTILAQYGDMQAELLYSKIADSYVPSQIQGEEATMLIDEIADPKELTIYYRDGGQEKIIIQNKKSSNMYYQIKEMVHLINTSSNADNHNQYSIMELKILDEARKQIGIIFPADKEGVNE